MKEKEFYISPDVLVFKVKVEGIICASTGNNSIPDWQDGDDFPNVF